MGKSIAKSAPPQTSLAIVANPTSTKGKSRTLISKVFGTKRKQKNVSGGASVDDYSVVSDYPGVQSNGAAAPPVEEVKMSNQLIEENEQYRKSYIELKKQHGLIVATLSLTKGMANKQLEDNKVLTKRNAVVEEKVAAFEAMSQETHTLNDELAIMKQSNKELTLSAENAKNAEEEMYSLRLEYEDLKNKLNATNTENISLKDTMEKLHEETNKLKEKELNVMEKGTEILEEKRLDVESTLKENDKLKDTLDQCKEELNQLKENRSAVESTRMENEKLKDTLEQYKENESTMEIMSNENLKLKAENDKMKDQKLKMTPDSRKQIKIQTDLPLLGSTLKENKKLKTELLTLKEASTVLKNRLEKSSNFQLDTFILITQALLVGLTAYLLVHK